MIRRHTAYAKYVILHKWFVLIECLKHGLTWRGLVHDLSKFRLSEWVPYARHFHAPNGERLSGKRDSTGYYKPTDTGDEAFDFAWLLHQKRNRHHWQWWILPEDGSGLKILEIPTKYVREMVCDWIGASRAQGHGPGVKTWYEKNKDKMQLHPLTRRHVEFLVLRWCG